MKSNFVYYFLLLLLFTNVKLYAQFESSFSETPLKILYFQDSYEVKCRSFSASLTNRNNLDRFSDFSGKAKHANGCGFQGSYFASSIRPNYPGITDFVGTSEKGMKYSYSSFSSTSGNVVTINIPNSIASCGYDIQDSISCGYSTNGQDNEIVLVINEVPYLFDFNTQNDDEAYSLVNTTDAVYLNGKSGNQIFISKHNNVNGNLINSFGLNGMILINDSINNYKATSLELSGNDLILTYISNNSTKIAKYNKTTSSINTSFGNMGTLNLFHAENDTLNILQTVLLPNGDIVIAEMFKNGIENRIVVSKINSSGQIDSNFNNGQALVLEGRYNTESLTLFFNDNTLKIWLSTSDYDMFRDGFVEISYGIDYFTGVIVDTTSNGECEFYVEAYDADFTSDNKILTLLKAGKSFGPLPYLVSFESTGEINRNFGNKGRLTLPSFFHQLEVADDGILLGGSGILKLDNFGVVDSSFGINGYATPSTSAFDAMHVMENGKIVGSDVEISSLGPSSRILTRYNPNGVIDSTFNFDGKVTFGSGMGIEQIVSKDNFIYTVGEESVGSQKKLVISKIREDGYVVYTKSISLFVPEIDLINSVDYVHSLQVINGNELFIGFTSGGWANPDIYSTMIDSVGNLKLDYGIDGFYRHDSGLSSNAPRATESGKLFYDESRDSIFVFFKNTSANKFGGVRSAFKIDSNKFVLFGYKDGLNNFRPNLKLMLYDFTANNDTSIIDTSITHIQNFIEPSIRIYPNPTKQELSVNLNYKYEKINIIQLDVLGRKIYSKSYFNSENIEFPLKGQAGMYVLHFDIDGIVSYKKVKKE